MEEILLPDSTALQSIPNPNDFVDLVFLPLSKPTPIKFSPLPNVCSTVIPLNGRTDYTWITSRIRMLADFSTTKAFSVAMMYVGTGEILQFYIIGNWTAIVRPIFSLSCSSFYDLEMATLHHYNYIGGSEPLPWNPLFAVNPRGTTRFLMEKIRANNGGNRGNIRATLPFIRKLLTLARQGVAIPSEQNLYNNIDNEFMQLLQDFAHVGPRDYIFRGS